MWWADATDEQKQQVRSFLKNKQLEFVNGGWAMNDEATTTFQDIITNM